MKKTVISILLVLLLIVGSLPMAASAAEEETADTGATTFNVTDAAHLRSALQTNGDIIVNIKNDIEFTMPDGYQWSEFSGNQDDTAYWTVIAQGSKTINLNGHRLYITDNQITHAKYKKVTYTYDGGSYTRDELEPNGYVCDAYMFRIDFGATLTVNGYSYGSEVMFDAQMPSTSQLIDNQVLTQRSLFKLNGGQLYLNGGEYQAGRRKTVYVTSAQLKDADWKNKEGVLWPTTHYYGNGEYAIGGNVIFADSGEAYISGGTLIAHGYYTGSNYSRNAVLKVKTGHIFMYDGTLKGYCGADAVQDRGDGYITIYAGRADTDAREMYLYPYGHHALSTESNYCAVRIEAGESGTGSFSSYYTDVDATATVNSDNIIVEQHSTYSPMSRSTGKPNWEDGSTEQRTILTGTSPKVYYDAGQEFFPTESIPGVAKRIEYFWTIQKQNGSKWSDVTGWLSSGTNNYTTLSPDTLESGATYRISAKREEYWSSTHNYTAKVQSSSALVFTVSKPEDYVISSVDLTCPAPVGGHAINFDTAQVTGLPDYAACTQIVWYKGGTKLQYQGDKAVTGETYEVWINLKTSVGKFASRSSLENTSKINGQKAGVMSSADPTEMTFKYTFPACEAPTQIVGVQVALDQEPVVGQTPCYQVDSRSPDVYIVEDYDVYPYQDGVAWFYKNGAEMKSTETFKAGNTYTVKISLVPANDGYEFATSGLSGTLNGKTAVVEAYNPSTATENICVAYTFTLPEEVQKITKVGVMIDEPKAGKKPSYAAFVTEGATYEVEDYDGTIYHDGVAWYDEEGNGIEDPDVTFEAGKRYRVRISLIPSEENTEFDIDNLIGYLNGSPAYAGAYSASSAAENVYVEYTFTVPEASAGYIIGDADTDGKITILDATAVQRTLASLPVQAFDADAADADEDAKLTILDATAIQRYLAALSTNPNIGTAKA